MIAHLVNYLHHGVEQKPVGGGDSKTSGNALAG